LGKVTLLSMPSVVAHLTLRFLDLPAPLLGFERSDGDDVLTCVFNLGHQKAEWLPEGAFTLLDSVNLDGDDAARPGPLAGLIARRLSI
jgi:hypothetical protein